MLLALELENFKAFGERVRVAFAPITLIFGENSAGKTSILQALSLLKQTIHKGESEEALLPRAENGHVDLGSYQELIFDHDLSRTLKIRVECGPYPNQSRILDTDEWARQFHIDAESLAELEARLALGGDAAHRVKEDFARRRGLDLELVDNLLLARTTAQQVDENVYDMPDVDVERLNKLFEDVNEGVKELRTQVADGGDAATRAKEEFANKWQMELSMVESLLSNESRKDDDDRDDDDDTISGDMAGLEFSFRVSAAYEPIQLMSLSLVARTPHPPLALFEREVEATSNVTPSRTPLSPSESILTPWGCRFRCTDLSTDEAPWYRLFLETQSQATRISEELAGISQRQAPWVSGLKHYLLERSHILAASNSVNSDATRATGEGDRQGTLGYIESQIRELSAGLRIQCDKLLTSTPDLACLESTQEQLREAREYYAALDAVSFPDDDAVDEYVRRMRNLQQTLNLYVCGILPAPIPARAVQDASELDVLRYHRLDVCCLAAEVGELIRSVLYRLTPLGPIRQAPKRVYMFSSDSPRSVGQSGETMPDLLLRHSHLVADVNRWLDTLDVGYHVDVQRVTSRAGTMFEVRLMDRRRATPVDVALSDVGFGVCQILPIVVQCVAGRNQILTIEQPEVHVHPRLQADLGELFASAIQPPASQQIVVETHSEHLVLRLQKLIRVGKLRPNDVSIIYVSRTPTGSQVRRLRLDGDGDFIDEWPGGFFPERLRELR